MEKEVEINYKTNTVYCTVKNYSELIDSIKKEFEEFKKEEFQLINKNDSKEVNRSEFQKIFKTSEIISLVIEKKKNVPNKKVIQPTKKISVVNIKYNNNTFTFKLDNYNKLINDIKTKIPNFNEKDFKLFEEKKKILIINQKQIEDIKKKTDKNVFTLIVEKKKNNSQTKKIKINYNSIPNEYPISDLISLRDKIKKDYKELNTKDFEIYDSNNKLISNEEDFENVIKFSKDEINLLIKKKEKKIKLSFYNNDVIIGICDWEVLNKTIESTFSINSSNYLIEDEKKKPIQNENDYKRLLLENSYITLLIKQKKEPEKIVKKEKDIISPNNSIITKETINDSIFDVFNELQNYIKENIDNKINKLNQNVENINNKISTINKDVIDLKNPKEEITIPNDNLRVLEKIENKMNIISESILNCRNSINGVNEKEIIRNIKALKEKGKNPIIIKTPNNFRCNINDILNNRVCYEIKIINESNLELPRGLKLKCEKDNDCIIFFNDMIINDGYPLKSKEYCNITILFLYNSHVKEYFPTIQFHFSLEKFSESLYEGTGKLIIEN